MSALRGGHHHPPWPELGLLETGRHRLGVAKDEGWHQCLPACFSFELNGLSAMCLSFFGCVHVAFSTTGSSGTRTAVNESREGEP